MTRQMGLRYLNVSAPDEYGALDIVFTWCSSYSFACSFPKHNCIKHFDLRLLTLSLPSKSFFTLIISAARLYHTSFPPTIIILLLLSKSLFYLQVALYFPSRSFSYKVVTPFHHAFLYFFLPPDGHQPGDCSCLRPRRFMVPKAKPTMGSSIPSTPSRWRPSWRTWRTWRLLDSSLRYQHRQSICHSPHQSRWSKLQPDCQHASGK